MVIERFYSFIHCIQFGVISFKEVKVLMAINEHLVHSVQDVPTKKKEDSLSYTNVIRHVPVNHYQQKSNENLIGDWGVGGS
ncbi:hypothetical protein DERP_001156 [Dermatophagoides pteronyssinus]|uniref:Uncharacterized protein n=1 Tax=Dermatophagoides pteronyssinus TaxID=6956 RepID=A0ABQ8JDN0_DERPT|nr:hypothetical protein DERP_001156 [Dermatophagoides pteronyssinus]